MELEDDEIVFHSDVLFGQYRADASLMKDITWLKTAPLPPEEAEEAEQPVAVPEPEQRDEKPLDDALARQNALVYTLFQYMTDDAIQPLMPSTQALVAMLGDRFKKLASVVASQAPLIERVWRIFVRRMLVEMLAEDQAGGKIREARQMLDEPYLLDAANAAVPGARSNWANVDRVRALTRDTVAESYRFKEDKFKEACEGPMKRGRRPGNVTPVTLNQLQVIKKHFTTKHSAQAKNDRAQQFDPYPLFHKVLSVVGDCIPDAKANHGWYLARLECAVRRLSSREWPALGLVRSLLNAERVLPRRRLTLSAEDVAQCGPLHCAYSGRALVAGDEVWHLRIVLNSGARYKKWQKRGRLPAVPPTDAFFTRSVRAYFVLTRVVSLSSLFYAELPPIAPPPLQQPQQPPSVLPENRQFCINTLWLLLNQQRQFITTNGLSRHVFNRHGQCYATEMQRLAELILSVNPLLFRQQFHTFLAIVAFGEAYVTALVAPDAAVPPNFTAYCDTLWDTVLDFVDVHFVFAQPRAGTPGRQTVSFAQFNLELLGVALDEGELTRKKFERQHGKLWPPQLTQSAATLASQLLWESTKRALPLMTYSERQTRLWRVQRLLQRHPFLFMALFDTLFESRQNHQMPALSHFPDALTLFNTLGLCIVTVH